MSNPAPAAGGSPISAITSQLNEGVAEEAQLAAVQEKDGILVNGYSSAAQLAQKIGSD